VTQELEDRIEALEAEIDDLSDKNRELTEELDDLKRENEVLTEKVEDATHSVTEMLRGLTK
jgi:chaperonin cofactor prefoldin